MGAFIYGEIVASKKISPSIASFSASEQRAYLEDLDGWLAKSHVLQVETRGREAKAASKQPLSNSEEVVGGCGRFGCSMMYYHEHVGGGESAPPPETSEFWVERPQLVNRRGETDHDIMVRRADGNFSDSD